MLKTIMPVAYLMLLQFCAALDLSYLRLSFNLKPIDDTDYRLTIGQVAERHGFHYE